MNNKELPDNFKNCLRNIEECCYNIANKNKDKKYNFEKLEFLNKEGFYNDKNKNFYKK